MGLFDGLGSKNLKFIKNAFSDLDVIKVIKPKDLPPLKINGKKQRRNILSCLEENKILKTGDYLYGGLFYCPFTIPEYKNEIHILFNVKKKNKNIQKIFEPDINDISYFIFDIKPYDEELRTIIFLSDERQLAESTQANLFEELHKRQLVFSVDRDTQLILKMTLIEAVDFYIKNLAELCFEDDDGKIKEDCIFPEIEAKKISKEPEIICIEIGKQNQVEDEVENIEPINEEIDDEVEEEDEVQQETANDLSEEDIINKSFEHLGTEFVLYNFKNIIHIDGKPNQRLDGKGAIEDLALGNNGNDQGPFDIICTQRCNPQRLFYFRVTESLELNEDTIFYYLTYQPTQLNEYHHKFALEVNARDNKKREIYIFEKLPKINSEEYSHINLNDMLIGMQFSLLFFKKANSEDEFKVFLEKCANKTLEVYQKNKMGIKMESYSNVDDTDKKENKDTVSDKPIKKTKENKNKTKEIKPKKIATNKVQILKCTGCKKEISKIDKFCRNCGKKVDLIKKCSRCKKPLKKTDKFCANCGTKA